MIKKIVFTIVLVFIAFMSISPFIDICITDHINESRWDSVKTNYNECYTTIRKQIEDSLKIDFVLTHGMKDSITKNTKKTNM